MTTSTAEPSRAHLEQARALAAASPWIDVHAHPGRCFLGGLPADAPLSALLGGDGTTAAVREIAASGASTVAFSTVADLVVLTATAKGLTAGRDFEEGEAVADHQRQVEALTSLTAHPAVRLIRHADDLADVHRHSLVGVIITCEGADFLDGQLRGLADAHAAGVRSVTLVHYRVNEVGDIQTEPVTHGGLTGFGAEVVTEMNRLGLLIDLAHATHQVTLDVIDRSYDPVVLSHSHLGHGQESHPRLLSDEHALAVASTGGLIGAWPAGIAVADLAGYVSEIVRLIELVGVDHVGIGTDMDANYRPVVTAYGQFNDIAAHLLARGLGPGEVTAVMGANYARVFAAVCG